jgi:hypothetical protein
MRKISFETKTHQGRSKTLFPAFFCTTSYVNSGSSKIRIPLVEFEIYDTFYIPIAAVANNEIVFFLARNETWKYIFFFFFQAIFLLFYCQ